MPHRLALAPLLLGLLLLPPGCGWGDGGDDGVEVLDQVNDPASYGLGTRADETREMAQTFTVGVAGRLTAVELLLEDFGSVGTDDLVVEIRTTTGGTPDADGASILAMGVISSSSLESPASFQRFDLDEEVPVAPGDVLAIVLKGLGAGFAFWWGGGDGTDYGPGAFFERTPSTGGVFELWLQPIDPFSEADLQFRTWVRED
jgi:hypothetical protein